jgi:hypothetical protein
MWRDGEAARTTQGDRRPSVQPAAPPASPYAEVAADLNAIFGPPPAKSYAERRLGARVVTTLEPSSAPRRRLRLTALAAAALIGVVGGGLLVWELLPLRGAGTPTREPLRSMIALAPLGDGAGPSVATETPLDAAVPQPAVGPPRKPGEGLASRRQKDAPFDARDDAPGQAGSSQPGQGAAPVMHDGGAALTGLSQTPEAFYALPSTPAGERPQPGYGCGAGEGRCSPAGAAAAADRRVRQAYAEAAAAGVSEEVLTGLRRNWSEIRDRYGERPGDLVTEYIRLADALVRARDRARIRDQTSDGADGPPRWTPDR